MASGLGLCVGSVNGTPCAHGNSGPAAAVIIEDGRPMCADHRRGYRMTKTVAARASGGQAPGRKDPSIGLRCIGSVNGEPCTRDNGGPAWQLSAWTTARCVPITVAAAGCSNDSSHGWPRQYLVGLTREMSGER